MNQIVHTPYDTARAAANNRPYIQDLSSGLFPGHFGFLIGGHSAGPNIVVAGSTRLTGQVYQRLLLLPTLSRLKGQLFLLDLDRLDGPDGIETVRDLLPEDAEIDGQLFLPFVGVDDMWGDVQHGAVKEAYWSVLRLCAALGMISGRGIPEQPVAPSEDFTWRSSRSGLRHH